MATMKQAMTRPLPLETFATTGPTGCLKCLGVSKDYSGCYVLLDADQPMYVGISRSIVSRLRQHVKGKSHFDASLAYRIATHRTGHSMRRSDAMDDDKFRVEFEEAKKYLRSMN